VQAKVDDLLAVSLGEFRPDVFVREPTDLAPIVASEVLGGLSVTYGLSRFIPMSSWEILGADVAMTRLRREYSLSNDPSLECMYAGLYLAVLPDSMEVHSPLPVPAVQRIRYVPWDGDATVESFGESERRGWPRVLMTLGTVYNQDRELFERLFAAVDGENIEVVCTLGDGADETVVESAPGNVRFVRYLPHSQILPTCDAMVCHGGFNTVLGALVAGVPLVVIPLGSDQDYNANLCARRGYGIALAGEEATSESIRMALRRVLSDRSFAAKVGVFQQTMAKRPPLGAAVRRIENLVAVGATR
jgi:UDP:flavonoid glycosyltransferase YjiC (YdhE family)